MLTLDGLRGFLKGDAVAPRPQAPAPDATRPRLGPPPKVGPPVGLTGAQPGEFARRLITIAGFGDPSRWGRDKVLLGLEPGELATLPEWVEVFPRSTARPFDVIVIESAAPASKQLGRSLFKKLQGENDLESALERMCQQALRGFAHAGGTASLAARPPGVPGGKQHETVVVASILDDRFDDEAPGQPGVHLLMFATRIGTEAEIKAGEGLETFVVRQECARWEPQLFEEYTERIYKRHFERLSKPEWRQAFVIEEERKKARALIDAATDPRGQVKLLGGASPYEKKLQDATFSLMEEVARGFGLRAKGGRVLERLELPPDHDIAADSGTRDRGEPNPLPGIVIRDQSSRLLGYIVYCLESVRAAEALRERLEKDNRFHNVLVIFPGDSGPQFELWQGTDRLDGKLVKRGSKYVADAALISLLARFFVVSRNRLTDAKELAEELAKRARFLRRLAERQLESERNATAPEDRQLTALYDAFRQGLIHGMKPGEFADAYAQTMTYGLLSARWVSKDELKAAAKNRKATDPVPQFTRSYAQAHLNSTSPFLQALFEKVLHENFEPKLAWLLDDIAALLNRVNVDLVFDSARVKSEVSSDPVIHFYEPFLAAYDKDLKKARGVYYTPQPVVSFIVRSVDEVLRSEFGLADGLASEDTWGDVCARFPEVKLPKGATEATPFVCILDPATGTGTFLVTVVETIFATLKARWEREGKDVVEAWQVWVPTYLLPRLNAFELMVASYAVAHLKVGLKLRELGYVPKAGERVNVFLTNALEPMSDDSLDIVLVALADEVRASNTVKGSQLVTVVVGNPPYSKSSGNRSSDAEALVQEFKDDVSGETNVQPLSDDYVKFIAISMRAVSRAGTGVVGVITNRSYLDGLLHRGLRSRLMETLPLLFVMDLHGDTNVGEAPPLGVLNENVFDITQGVAIFIGARVGAVATRAVRHRDLWGTRAEKYSVLNSSVDLYGGIVILPQQPYYFFLPKNMSNEEEFSRFPALSTIARVFGMGVKSRRDSFLLASTQAELVTRFARIAGAEPVASLKRELEVDDVEGWSLAGMRELVRNYGVERGAKPIAYRPFDTRYIWYHPQAIERGDARWPTMQHVVDGGISLVVARQTKNESANAFFVARGLSEMKLAESTRGSYAVPLTLRLPGIGQIGMRSEPNLSHDFLAQLCARVGVDALDDLTWGSFMYAVFYAPSYRQRYSESLKIEFPRVPLPGTAQLFKDLAQLGHTLIALHLMDESSISKLVLPEYSGPNSVAAERPTWSDGSVRLSKQAWIRPVPAAVWNFEIGGYQVCHKWLADRAKTKRTLTPEDILHYRRIIAAIGETIRIMGEIDTVIEAHGGWPGAFVGKT